MTEASAASQLASAMRSAVSHQARSAREAVKPAQVADQLKASSAGASGTSPSSFDATGQISPSAKSDSKSSATSNILDLLA